MKLRTERAIKIEYERVKKAMETVDDGNRPYLYGAMQALAWVFDDHAQSPEKAFTPTKKRKSS